MTASRLVRSAAYLLVATLAGVSVVFVSLPAQANAPAGVVARYDAARDAVADLARAEAAARSTGKRVLAAVGGDWCKDCRELDRLFADNAALTALRDRRFVWVKVFVGSENRNEAALSRLPKIDWMPTLVVLDAGGRVQSSVPSTEFHVEERLSATCVQAFLASH